MELINIEEFITENKKDTFYFRIDDWQDIREFKNFAGVTKSGNYAKLTIDKTIEEMKEYLKNDIKHGFVEILNDDFKKLGLIK